MNVTLDINSDKELRKEVLSMVEGQLAKLGRDHVQEVVAMYATHKLNNMSTVDLNTIVASKLDSTTVRQMAEKAMEAWTQERVNSRIENIIEERVDTYVRINGRTLIKQLLHEQLSEFKLNITLDKE
jgi:Glu-tRNA(Gln) amidotransferase subunit E-like FAD-binding protein